MLQTVVLTALAVLLVPGVAFAQLVELEGRYWFTDLKASVNAKSGSVPGTDIDFADDLGLESGDAPEARLTFFAGPFSRIRLAYTHLNFEGDKTLGRTITFAGDTFTANARVASELEIHYGRVGWLWQPLTIPGKLRFGGLLEAKGFFIDASLRTRGTTPAVKESAFFPLVLPTLGLALDVTPLPKGNLFAEASGLPAGDLGHIVDAEAGIRFVPIRFFSLSTGYRIFDIRVGESDDFAKLRISGPFVGASLRF
jgi:hypothetical protein